MLKEQEKYTVEITDLSDMGEGIGRIEEMEGMVVFVPEAIPGDIVQIEITKKKKSFAKGKVVEIVKPSSFRTEPFCPYWGECGGCSLQIMSYEGQLALKKKWVTDRLVRIGGIEDPKVSDVIPMEEPYRYRNKAQFPVGRVRGAEKKERGCNLGFYRLKSHEVINCDSCLLQTEPAERIGQVIRRYVKETKLPIYDPKTGTGVLRHVIVKTAFGTGEVMVILVATERKLPAVEWLVEEICNTLENLSEEINLSMGEKEDYGFYLESLILNVNKTKNQGVMDKVCITLAGKPTIKDYLSGMEFEISPLSFYQVNPIQTEKLYEKVKQYAALNGTETVLDLYCGVGTIGLTLAHQAKKVIGIESVKAAVLDANRNAVINGIVNAEFICGKAEEELPKLLEQGVQADLVVLDPPRAGCSPELLEAVAEAGPPRIVYVSCDPATLARDVKLLTQKGYRFVEAQPVDMFPWVGHVECVTLMSRVEE
ncbi:MAG: 23S rRNA (uracil(1939)-C(5))-methyltransferase RlmD [Anaerovoracaceae bacterium]|jgi:23S rRNA (uracil1939-C5)-methyltransferase